MSPTATSSTAPSPKVRSWVAALVLLAGALLLFAPIVRTALVSDDWQILEGIAHEGPFGIWTHGTVFFRPLTSLLLWLEHSLFGLAPAGYHLTSVALHALSATSVLMLVRALEARRLLSATPLLAPLSAALFLALPSHTEPVSWISAQGDLVASALSLAALAMLFSRASVARPASGFLMLGALLAKESALAVPLVAALLVGAGSKESLSARARALLPFALALVVYVPLRRVLIGRFVGGYGTELHLTPTLRALGNTVIYPVRAILPPIYESSGTAVISFALAVLVVLVTIVAGVSSALRRGALRPLARESMLLFSAFLLGAVPVMTLRVDLRSVEAERILYLPSAFLAVLLARLVASARPASLVASASALVMGCASFQGALTWRGAARIADEVVVGLTELEGTRALFVGLPDAYRGAGILRNGLDEAMRTLRPSRPIRIAIVGFLDLTETEGGIDLHASEQGWDAAVSGSSHLMVFDDPPRADYEDDDARVRGLGPRGLHLELRGHEDALLFLEGGHLKILRPPRSASRLDLRFPM